jgi:aryl-alcohol dehydrogenase-like predicted oxidoreductase
MAWSPLAGGFLTGKYDRDNVDQAGTRVAMSTLPYDRQQGLGVVDALRDIAAGRGCTVAQAALAWVIARPAVSSAVIGVSGLGQLDELATGTDVILADEEIAVLDAASPMRPLYPHWHIDASQDNPAYVALGIDKPVAVGGAGRGAVSNRH